LRRARNRGRDSETERERERERERESVQSEKRGHGNTIGERPSLRKGRKIAGKEKSN
jgi:hypothetical protein